MIEIPLWHAYECDSSSCQICHYQKEEKSMKNEKFVCCFNNFLRWEEGKGENLKKHYVSFFLFKNENDNYVPFTIIFSINRVRFWIKKCDLSHQDIEKCFWVKH